MKRNERKQQRQAEAAARQAEYDDLTDSEKAAKEILVKARMARQQR